MCPNLIINQDNFDLTQSQNQTFDGDNWDIEIDLCLKAFTGNSVNFGAGKVTGIVTDSNNKKIENVTVILMASDAKPLFQDKTDLSGEYLIDSIPQGTYFIMTKYPGKVDQKTDNFFVAPLSTIKRNFILKSDNSALVGIILGSILGAGVALVGIAVAIYFGGQLVATGITGAGGAFLVGGLVAGAAYLVSVAVPGFLPYAFEQVAKTPEEVNNNENQEDDSHDLEIDYSFASTISGIIRDSIGVPIYRASVILYRVNLDNTLSPIAFMKTNREGLYLFKVPLGKYKVKSSQNTTITID